MSRVIAYGLLAMAIGLSGCQKANMKSNPTAPASAVNFAPSNPGLGQPLPPGGLPPVIDGPVVELPPRTPGHEGWPPPGQPGGPVDLPLPLDPSSPGVPTTTRNPQPEPIDTHPTTPGVPVYPVTPVTPQEPSRPVVTIDPPPVDRPVQPLPPDRPVVTRPPVTPVTPDQPVRPLQPNGPTQPTPSRTDYPTPVDIGTVNPRPVATGGGGGYVPPKRTDVAVLRPNEPMTEAPLPPRRPVEFGGGSSATGLAGGATPKLKLKPQGIESVGATCEERPVKVTKHNKKLSFVFMVDTSASLVKAGNGTKAQGDLTAIAHGMRKFIEKLEGRDYRIGVVLAHGPQSKWFGKLFSLGAGDPLVLDSKTMSEDAIIASLERKMKNVPDDKSDAQGEALLMGLYQISALTASRQALADAKLYTKDRDVVMIAVTDEQDVCFDYTNSGFTPTKKPLKIGGVIQKDHGNIVYAEDPFEKRFRENVCSRYLPGHMISYKDVVESLHSLEDKLGGKVMMSAIAHATPQPPFADNEDEKEQAHGIIELVDEMRSGVLADLGQVDHNGNAPFANELTQLGESAKFQLSYSGSFECATSYAAESIDTISPADRPIVLSILDHDRPIARYSTACEAGRPCQQADGALSWRIETRNKKKVLRVFPADQAAYARALQRSNIDNPTQKISFSTRDNVDTKTGKRNDGKRVTGPTEHGPIPSTNMTSPLGAAPSQKGTAAKPAAPLLAPTPANQLHDKKPVVAPKAVAKPQAKVAPAVKPQTKVTPAVKPQAKAAPVAAHDATTKTVAPKAATSKTVATKDQKTATKTVTAKSPVKSQGTKRSAKEDKAED